MTTFEILTIILTVFSGIVAVSAILVPIILNYLTKRAENKNNSQKDQDKLKYKEYRLKYMNLVDELTLNFSNYISNILSDNQALLLSSIYRLKILSDEYLKNLLNGLLNEVQSEVFNKSKLLSAFNKFLEEISEESFRNYWYGTPFNKAHRDLIN